MKKLNTFFSLELRRARALVKKIYTGKHQLGDLPEAMQHFVQRSGFLSAGNIHQVKIEWKNTMLKLDQTKKWLPIHCIQHNFIPDPIRLVYMKTKIYKIFGLEGFDSFRHGHGAMMVRLGSIFDLTNAKGAEMDKAALVTILAETMIVPDYAMQTYITWEEIHHYAIKGTINYHGIEASGIFSFNHNFEIEKFETDDRYFTDRKGKFQQVKWTAKCSDYRKHGTINFPTKLTSTWNFPTGDFTYFQGEINNVYLNP